MITRVFVAYLCAIIVVLSGCRKTADFAAPPKPNEQQVTLRLLMPQNNSKVSTYAIGEFNQNSIYTLDVLAFKVADDGREYYAYHKRAVLLSANEESTAVNFHVDLLKSTDRLRFVLIANAGVPLQTALGKLPANAEKETLMGLIEYGITSKWNASSSSSYTPLPMWGESVVIDGINVNTQRFSVRMLRSLAAIDVGVSANDFVMTKVYVYNMSNKGRVAPIPENYNATEYWVDKPSLPSIAPGRLPAQEYTTVTGDLAGEIFLFESVAPTNTGDLNTVGLVIAGKYGGSNVVTYYRVELTDSQGKLLPVLRNHRYAIDITKVHAAGFSSQAEAWASKAVGMTAEVTKWNEITVSDGNVPLQYLKLAATKVELLGLQGQTTFTIWTNAPTHAVNLILPTWLINLGADRDGDKITYMLHVNENGSTTTVRSATISVQVGRLTGKLEAKQAVRPIDLGPDYGFYIVRNDLTFAGYWDKIANVPSNLISPLDASLTQREPPYPESCVARFGPGARLPTMYELRQLLPTDHNGRMAVNALIQAKGGSPMMYNQTSGVGSIDNPYLSSTSASWLNSGYSDVWFVTIRSDIGAAYATDHKFTNQGYMNNRARCVMSKK